MRSSLKVLVVLFSVFMLVFPSASPIGKPSFALAGDENENHGEYIFDEGDRVDTYTGILTLPRTDLSLPGKGGLNLEITRVYSSEIFRDTTVAYADTFVWGPLRPIESPFGMGWYFQIGRIDVTTKTIYYGDGGSEQLFYDNYEGTYQSRMKTRQYAVWQYTQGADTSYLKTPDGMVLKFDMTSNDQVYGTSNKYVVRIEDKNGNHITIEYFQNTPFIRKIYDTVGRTVWFTYFDTTSFSRDTRLKNISYLNSNGDTCKVEYEYTNGLLSKVTYPNGTYESYEYILWRHEGTSISGNILSAVTLPTGGRIQYQFHDEIYRYKWLIKKQSGNCVVDTTLRNARNCLVVRDLISSKGTVSSKSIIYTSSHGMDWEFRCHSLQSYGEDSYPAGVHGLETVIQETVGGYPGDEIDYIYYPFLLASDSSDCVKPYHNGSLKTIRSYDNSRGQDLMVTSFLYDRQIIGYTNPNPQYHTEDSAIWVPVVKDVYKTDYSPCYSGQLAERYAQATRYLKDSHTGTMLKREVYSLCDTLQDWSLDNAQQFIIRKDTVSAFELDSAFNYLYVEGTSSIEGTDTVYNQYQYTFAKPTSYVKSLNHKTLTSGGVSLEVDFGFDTSGNVNYVYNPNYSSTFFHYTQCSGAYLTSVRTPADTNIIDSTTYYPNTGLPKTKVDANRNVTQFFYDRSDRIRKVTRPLDSDTINPSVYYVYDDSNRIVYEFVKQENGNYIKSSKHFDEFGRPYETRQYGGNDTTKTIVQYNSIGKIERISRTFKNTPSDTIWTDFKYDALGRVIKTINPDSTRDSTYYKDLTVERYDELNKRYKNIYDVRGNLLYSLGNWNGAGSAYKDTLSYTYGNFNKLLQSKSPKGFVTQYWYNSLFRISADSTADRGKNLYLYDRIGNLRFRKDATGLWIYNKYDQLNRLTEQGTLPQGTTPTQSNAYQQNYPSGIGEVWKIKNKYGSYSSGVVADDSANHTNPKGNLTEVQDQSGHTYYFYDKRNRLVQQTTYITGLAEKKVKYHYNYADQLDTLFYPDGTKLPYQYDQMGRLKSVPGYADSSGTGAGFEYADWGAITQVRFNNGMTTGINYNDRGFITKIRHMAQSALLWGRGYGRDAKGDIVREYSLDLGGTITDTLRAYAYDGLYRLTSAQLRDYSNKLMSYGYDANGNRSFEKVNSDSTSYFYNANTNQLNHITGQVTNNYVYDARGSITQDSSKAMTISYDYRNMPAGIYHRKTLLGHTVADVLYFYYNAQGQRVKKRFDLKYVCDCGSIPEPNAMGATGELQAEAKALKANGSMSTKGGPPIDRCVCTMTTYTYYVYSGSQIIAEYDGIGNLASKYVYGNGQRIAKVDSLGAKSYYHNDYLGSTRIMTNQGATKVFERDYYPFGAELFASGSGTDYKYNGKEFDDEAGINLYYYGARYYDPKIGRFLSIDPINNYTNSYSYVHNNPINASDPTGMWTEYHPVYTHGGWFGGYFFGSLMDMLGSVFTNASGLTDREEFIDQLRAQGYDINVSYQGKDYTVHLDWNDIEDRLQMDFDNEMGAGDLVNAMLESKEYEKLWNALKGKEGAFDTFCNIFIQDFYGKLGVPFPKGSCSDIYRNYSLPTGPYLGGPYWKRVRRGLPGDVVVWSFHMDLVYKDDRCIGAGEDPHGTGASWSISGISNKYNETPIYLTPDWEQIIWGWEHPY